MENYLIIFWDLPKEYIFSNMPDLIRDSIFIDQEMQFGLKGLRSVHFHHQNISFKEEYIDLLKKYKLAYNETYLW